MGCPGPTRGPDGPKCHGRHPSPRVSAAACRRDRASVPAVARDRSAIRAELLGSRRALPCEAPWDKKSPGGGGGPCAARGCRRRARLGVGRTPVGVLCDRHEAPCCSPSGVRLTESTDGPRSVRSAALVRATPWSPWWRCPPRTGSRRHSEPSRRPPSPNVAPHSGQQGRTALGPARAALSPHLAGVDSEFQKTGRALIT
jgi:hypothetical protein